MGEREEWSSPRCDPWTPFLSQVWRSIVPHLTGRLTVCYFDLVGYGQSEMRDEQDVSLGVQNKFLSRFLAK